MEPQHLDPVVRLANTSVEAPHWTLDNYQQILQNSPSNALQRCCLVGLRESALAGFAVARWLRQEATAEIEALVVDERYRRQRIGSELLGACKAWAARAGATSIRLEVRVSNAAALALYQRQGFTSTGCRHAYYSHPVEDAVLLLAALTPPATGGAL